MKLRLSSRTAAVLLTCALALAGQEKPAGTPKDQAPKPVKGSIEGKVVDAGTGMPVKDVSLLLMKQPGTGTPSAAKSNEEGHFQFKDLDPGTYVLIGDHPRYAKQTYGSRNGLLGGTPLMLSAGQEMKDVTFKLLSNGVVAGKVTDPDGEPVPKVLVFALKSMFQRGRREYLPLAQAMTNDLGEYRLSNLAAGRYLVSATVFDAGAAAKPAGDEPETALLKTYFPNAPDATGAAWVQVTAGADTGSIDIKMARAKAVRVKGKVMGDLKDQSVTVKLVPKDGGMLASITARGATAKKGDGTFEISGVTQGSYTLRPTDQTGLKVLGAGVPVEITDKSVEGLVVELAVSAELSGALLLEGTDAKPATGLSLKGTQVYLESAGGTNLMPPNTKAAEDGTFSFKDLPPDKYFVRVVGGPENSYLESVQLGGQKMGEGGLDMAGGRGKLEIKMRTAGAEVDGVVHGQDDNPISGVTVALIPDNGQYLLYQGSASDQNGAFRMKGITPGEYKLLAWEEIEPGAFMDPEFVKPFLGKAEKVSLKENDRKALTIKVIPRGE